MSPAGYWPQLHAAIEAGADSVYFGLKHFTARAKVGFTLEELPEAMRTLHRRGVKGFITFNTLIFEHELKEAARSIAAIAEAGADALIIQDIGMAKLAHEIAPGVELHASTQMSITSAEGVELARRFGVSRVTLARELSMAEIRSIRAATDCELEVFVHGALCVAYSGQCFSSEAWGGRSANRGQCAQACRLPYELMVDGEWKPLGESRYLLSPGDLYALHQVPELVEIGVSALKIEGRYKSADYVALATRAYRKAVDDARAGLPLSITAAEELQLEQVYSRGLGAHFVSGTNHQTVVEGRAPRHRGLRMGRVVRVLPDAVLVETGEAHKLAPLKPGDGLVFDAATWRSPEEPEEGGRVYQVARQQGGVELRFANGAVNWSRIRAGDLVWRTHDPDLDAAARPYLEATVPVAKQPVNVKLMARAGEALRAEWWLEERPDIRVQVEVTGPLTAAHNRALSKEFAREQLGRLGNTAYTLRGLEVETEGSPFVPASMLNQLRREGVAKLEALQSAPGPVVVREPLAVVGAALERLRAVQPAGGEAEIHLLVRTVDQLDAALEFRPATITLDYLDLYGLLPSVERVKAAGIAARVASPRVLKPGEERIVNFLLKLRCPILVRSTGLLQTLKGRECPELTGDFSLNAANPVAAQEMLNLGLSRLTPGHDLNAAQTVELAHSLGAEAMEAIVYHHLPVFHMEHCVFCRFLSTGTSFKDCGRPCETHRVELRDVGGRSHPVLADIGCRNTVFGSEAQEASAHLESWRRAGIRHLRLEFAHESGVEVTRIAQAFREALAGERSFAWLGQELGRAAPRGTTEGSLFVPAEYKAFPILQ